MSLQAARAQPPADTSTGNFLSSLKQAINKDFDHEVVRGHFDVGNAPDSHRFYCLIDARTGKVESNGVAGQPFLRPDGMTGIKGGAVSFYSCANAEQRGVLITAGYVSMGGSAAARDAGTEAAPAAAAAPIRPEGVGRGPMVPRPAAVEAFDIAGLRLGMSPEQVRLILKSKKLLDYHESAQYLTADPAARDRLGAGGRYINTIAAWNDQTGSGADSVAPTAGESYEIMFTPVPGAERVMSIIHTVSYAAESGLRERTAVGALLKKYGGYEATAGLPASPTWRVQSGGTVQTGDSCGRRGVLGGIRDLHTRNGALQNLALKTTPEEFQYQIDHCGVAILTEDHVLAEGPGARPERTIRRFSVAAYSPALGLEGATAAMQLMQTANAVERSMTPQPAELPQPIL